MTTRQSHARFILILSALTAALLSAACASGGGNANTTNTAAANSATTNAATTNAAGTPATNAPAAKLNLNTATREEFMAKVPNLGGRMAHEFEEYRPYKSIQQFRKEMAKYVDAAKIAEYERYVFVPVNENEADAATLQQIPGLDEKEAAELAGKRPYASRTAFVGELSSRLTPEELAVAMTYLGNR